MVIDGEVKQCPNKGLIAAKPFAVNVMYGSG